MSDDPEESCRSAELNYSGYKHSYHIKLQKWRLWGSVIGTFLVIIGTVGGAGVWAGSQIWYSKKSAKKYETHMTDEVQSIGSAVNALKNEIGRLQAQMRASDRKISQFIDDTKRLRLERLIRETEQEIATYQRLIEKNGDEARGRDRDHLQSLKSERARYQRELEAFYRRNR